MEQIQEFNVEKSTKTVAICNCPVGASFQEVTYYRSMFKAAMKDLHIAWDIIKQINDGPHIVFIAMITDTKIVAC